MPEAAGCDPSLCRRLPDAVIAELVDVHWLQGALLGLKNGSLAKEVVRGPSGVAWLGWDSASLRETQKGN